MTQSNSGTLTLTTPSDREILMTREFDAPRELLFKAYTDPAAIPHWWGPRKYAVTVEAMDVRVGGAWRYISRDADGAEFAFNGVYREIAPPERIVSTFEFEGMPGHISVETMVLEDIEGKTRMTVTSAFDSQADRDGMLQSGMEQGAGESYARLDAYLLTMS